MKRLLYVLIATASILITAPAASSQDSGSVTGVVRQADKSPVENALVKISGDLLPGGRTFTIGRDGQFRFMGLLPGTYVLETTHPEMASLNERETIIVGLGRSVQVIVVMVPVGRHADA